MKDIEFLEYIEKKTGVTSSLNDKTADYNYELNEQGFVISVSLNNAKAEKALQYFSDLYFLKNIAYISENEFDIKKIKSLKNLGTLRLLAFSPRPTRVIKNFDEINNLTKITTITLDNCFIDHFALDKLKFLEKVEMNGARVSYFKGFNRCESMQSLNANRIKIDHFINAELFGIKNLNIDDVEPVLLDLFLERINPNAVEHLVIGHDNLKDVTFLESMGNLDFLKMTTNSDFMPFVFPENLKTILWSIAADLKFNTSEERYEYYRKKYTRRTIDDPFMPIIIGARSFDLGVFRKARNIETVAILFDIEVDYSVFNIKYLCDLKSLSSFGMGYSMFHKSKSVFSEDPLSDFIEVLKQPLFEKMGFRFLNMISHKNFVLELIETYAKQPKLPDHEAIKRTIEKIDTDKIN